MFGSGNLGSFTKNGSVAVRMADMPLAVATHEASMGEPYVSSSAAVSSRK